jgi:hypothetical protein
LRAVSGAGSAAPGHLRPGILSQAARRAICRFTPGQGIYEPLGMGLWVSMLLRRQSAGRSTPVYWMALPLGPAHVLMPRPSYGHYLAELHHHAPWAGASCFKRNPWCPICPPPRNAAYIKRFARAQVLTDAPAADEAQNSVGGSTGQQGHPHRCHRSQLASWSGCGAGAGPHPPNQHR